MTFILNIIVILLKPIRITCIWKWNRVKYNYQFLILNELFEDCQNVNIFMARFLEKDQFGNI